MNLKARAIAARNNLVLTVGKEATKTYIKAAILPVAAAAVVTAAVVIAKKN
jgi:ribosomal protein L23